MATGVGFEIVVRELERHGIKLRKKGLQSSKMDDLKIGESVIMNYEAPTIPYATVYQVAAARNIKISIRRVDASHFRVTRQK